jgi:branched-chain amino acid transport system substrate-binding protein
MGAENKVSRRKFLAQGAAVGVVAAGIVAGVAGYYGGVSAGKGQQATTTIQGGAQTVTTTQTVTAAGSTSTGPAAILVGQSTQLTGPEGPLGGQNKLVTQFEVDKINAAGGIYVKEFGRQVPVQYIVLDDTSDVTKSVANMNTLYTQDHVNFFFGTGGSVTTAQVQVAIEDKMIYIGGANDTPEEWAKVGTMTFGYFSQLKANGSPYPGPTVLTPLWDFIDALPASQKPTSIAIWEDDSTEGDAMCGPNSDVVLTAKDHGLQIVFNQKYETGGSDYTSLISATKAANPDIIYGIPQPPDFITLKKQSDQLQLTPKMWYFAKGPSAQPVNEALAQLAAGVFTPVPWTPGGLPGSDVEAAYKAGAKSTPGWPAIAFAVSDDILFQAIEKAGTLDPSAVANVLHAETFYTTLGPVKFNPDGSFYPPEWIQQMVYHTTPNALGEHVGYRTTPLVYPLTPGCCQD